MTGAPGLYAVFGSPIGHSLSPVMHEAAFRSRGWDHLRYIPVEVSREGLKEALDAFRALGGVGVNLTRPLKQAAARAAWLARQDHWAETAGVVNTLVWRDGGWSGANTDVPALRAAIAPRLHPGSRILLFGSGGAARATWQALRDWGPVTVASRRAPDFGDPSAWVPWALGVERALEYDVVVNATPLGQIHEPAWERLPVFRSGQGLVEWVYRPRRTPLVDAAEGQAAWIVDGLELLARQAALSWTTWFGEEGPWRLMQDAAAPQC